MMLSMDCIFMVGVHSDYDTIVKLMNVYPFAFYKKNVWKLKCEREYPNKKYFNFWSSKENYLIRIRGDFCIYVNKTYQECASYIYEYDDMLKQMLRNMYTDRMDYMLNFKIEDQFIVIQQVYDGNFTIIGEYESNEKALECVKINESMIINRTLPGIRFGQYVWYSYAIINIERMKPQFWNLQNNTNNDKSKEIKVCTEDTNCPIKFYNGDTNSSIKF